MMCYDRDMVISSQRARLWPFLLMAFLGVFLLGLGVAVLGADQVELPRVELLK